MLVANISNPRFVDVFMAEDDGICILYGARGSVGGVHAYRSGREASKRSGVSGLAFAFEYSRTFWAKSRRFC